MGNIGAGLRPRLEAVPVDVPEKSAEPAEVGALTARPPPPGAYGRLPPGAVRDNALSDIEEIRTPGMIDDAEALPEEDPEDAIIRLD